MIAMRKQKYFRAAVPAVLLMLFAAALLSAAGPDTPPAPRVGIILGHYPAGADEPTSVQTARCLKAFELYRDGKINKVLVTGGYTRDHISEARMMKIALVTYGVPPDDVIEDELANSTIENGYFSARLFERSGWEKKAYLISQKGHLWRAKYIFEDNGFKIKEAAAAETASPAFAGILNGAAPESAPGAAAAELLIVYEPFDSPDPMPWPAPALARRLRAAAALWYAKHAPRVVLYSDWYARGPVDLAQMMKVALVSLGVPAENIDAVPKVHYGKLPALIRTHGDRTALVITAPNAAGPYDTSSIGKWKFLYIE